MKTANIMVGIAVGYLPALARGGADGQAAEARIVDIVAAQRKISRGEAQAQVTRARQQFVQTKNETVATAKSATDKVAGAAAAGLGATTATRRLR